MKNIEEITKELEKGVKDVFDGGDYQRYLDFVSKFYDYSVNNVLLIFMQKPDASYVAGYKTWQTKFNRQVRKGEKGITILAPLPRKYKKEIQHDDGTVEEKEFQYTAFRAVSVFDISQTDGEEIPSICTELEGTVGTDIIEKVKAISPVPVSFKEIKGGAKGYYDSASKSIVICSGMSELQTLKTLVHEISHAKLHDKDNGEEHEADRRTKEVQAESVAYVVCSYLGLDKSDYSFGYIAGWGSGKETKELIASMDTIRKTASNIIDELKKTA